MVLEKQDSGISLTSDTLDAGKTSEPDKDDSKSFEAEGVNKDEHVPLHKTVCCVLCRKKHSKPHRHSVSQSSLDDDVETRTRRTGSLSDVSSVSSARSTRSSFLADAKPISDPQIRKKLQGAQDSNTRVTTKDQKMLERMLAKKEEEKRLAQNRENARQLWEKEREKTALTKAKAELKRRRSFQEQRVRAEQCKTSDLGLGRESEACQASCHSHQVPGNHQDCKHCSRNHDREVERRCKEVKASCAGRCQKEEAIHYCERRNAEISKKQLELKQKRLEEQKLKNLERKKSVEERLERQRRESAEFQLMIKAKQMKELRRSQSMKDAKEQETAMRAKLSNYHAKKKQEEKWSRMKRQSAEDLVNLKATITAKHTAAETKVKEAKKTREEQLRQNLSDLEKRLERSKLNQKKLGEDMAGWQKELLQYRKLQEDQALKTAQKKVLEKKTQAAEDRAKKERIQKENLQILKKQEKEWKADMEATLAMKDARSKIVAREKQELVEESRKLASTSRKLREELRQHYSMNDLDKLNKQAELHSRLT